VRIEVEAGALSAEGAGQSQLAGQIMELAGELGRASAAACAAGDPQLSGAINDCLATWSQSLSMLAGSVEGLGANLSGAAGAYTGTDLGAMPARVP
jgi:hypothetical protein